METRNQKLISSNGKSTWKKALLQVALNNGKIMVKNSMRKMRKGLGKADDNYGWNKLLANTKENGLIPQFII